MHGVLYDFLYSDHKTTSIILLMLAMPAMLQCHMILRLDTEILNATMRNCHATTDPPKLIPPDWHGSCSWSSRTICCTADGTRGTTMAPWPVGPPLP